MAVTRIKNNQITDATIVASAKLSDYTVTAAKLANNITYASDLTIAGNLTVNGNTTTIDTTVVTIEDPMISLAYNQTGSPTLDIGFIGERGTSNNIAFVWDESSLEFITAFTSDTVANTTITVLSYADFHTNNANIGGNIVINGTTSLVGNISGALNVTGTITGGNIATAGTISGAGNVTGGNVNTAGQVSAAGNVTGNALNGATLSLSGNVTSALNVTGNIAGGNVNTAGLVSATGNVIGGNLTTGGIVSATGTITGGNLSTSGTATVTGNISGGNISTGGQISATGNINGSGAVFTGNVSAQNFVGNISGNIDAGGANTNIQFNDGDILAGSAAFTFDKTSNAVTASGNITAGNFNTAGLVSASGNVTGGNVNTAGQVSASGNVTGNALNGATLSLSGNVTSPLNVTGNIAGGNISTAGVVNSTGNITGGNINTAGQVSATGAITSGANVSGANVTTTGQVSASGNVTGGNVLTGGVVSATGNVTGGNLNSTKVYSASSLSLTTASGDIIIDASGNINASSNYINNLLDPVQAQDAATKQYVDDAVSTGITIHTPVYLEANSAVNGTYAQGGTTYTVNETVAGNTVVFSSAANLQVNDQLWFTSSFQGIVANKAYFVVSAPNTSAAVLSTTYGGAPVSNITSATGLSQSVRVNSGIGATLTNAGANATLVVDGVTVSNGQRILIYSQANAVHNGVYVVSNAGNATSAWVLTRSTDTDVYGPKSTDELDVGDYFYVQAGDTGAGESYVMTAPTGPFIIGYDNLTFTQFSASQVYTANTSAGLSLTGTVFSAKVDNNTTAFDGGGNIIVKASANLTTPNIGAATGTSLSVTGNITGGNVNTGGQISTTGNIAGGNINTAGQVSAGGNVTGDALNGNTLSLSGNVTSALNVTGNIAGGNIATAGVVSATGTVTGGNIATGGTISGTGNITGGNVSTAGIVTATGTITGGNVATGGTVSATGNVTGGNVLTGGLVSATGTITSAANITGANVNTGGVVSATGTITGGNIATGGTISGTGNITGGNVATAGVVTATGTITGGNIATGGTVSATGNVTGDALNGNTLSLSGNVTSALNVTGNIAGGNVNTAGQVSATGTITGGNLSTGGTATVTGNITGGNVNTGGKVVATGTGTFGNITVGIDSVDSVGTRITVNNTNADVDFTVNGDTVANVFYVDAGTGTASFGSSSQTTGAIVAFNSPSSVLMPVGNTAQRPGTGVTGMLRFNSTTDSLEVYDNNSWTTVGVPSFTVIADEQFSGDGSTVAFTLATSQTTNSCIVSINGVVQIPTVAYSVSGTTLTFTEAPLAGDLIDVRQITTTTTVTGLSNSSGNAEVLTSDTSNVVTVTGQLSVTGGIIGLQADQISNGTSNVKVVSSGGNITTSVGGTSNVMVVASTGVSITGDLAVTGNATLSGNILGDRVQNGTTSFDIQTQNGNANITVGGTSNVAVFSPSLVTLAANLLPSANITYNLGSSTQRWNDLWLSNSTIYLGNAQISANATSIIMTNPQGGQTVLAGTTANITGGTVSVTGNITGGNVLTGGLISATGNITGGNILGGANVNATTHTGATVSVTGNITGGNVLTGGLISATGAITGAALTGTSLTVSTGNITGGNLILSGAIEDSAQLDIRTTAGNGNIVLTPNGTGVIVASKDIVNGQANGVGNIGSATGYFNTVFAKATSAQYADLAEKYVADDEYAPGTVVVFGGSKEVTVSSADADTKVAGVVSTNPSYIMNGGLEAEHVATVALTGRVPCRVTGTVRKGDLMVSAGYGLARAEANPRVGTVIGKALADFDGQEGVIEVVVGRF